MKIFSQSSGAQQIDSAMEFVFPKGINGFEEHTRFRLMPQDDSLQLYKLESGLDASVAFWVAQPSAFNMNYCFILTQAELDCLQIERPDELLILVILQKDADNQPFIKGTMNSPLLINRTKNIGMEKLLIYVDQAIVIESPQHSRIELIERV